MSKFFVKLISTFFFFGYLPLIPGTFASLLGILLFYFLKDNFFLYLFVTITITILGFLVGSLAEEIFKRKDPPIVVIDEVSGMLLSLVFIPFKFSWVIAAFVLFRILDIAKPYPAWRLQQFKGSLGIMADDLVAAVYTNIILQIVLRLASFKIS